MPNSPLYILVNFDKFPTITFKLCEPFIHTIKCLCVRHKWHVWTYILLFHSSADFHLYKKRSNFTPALRLLWKARVFLDGEICEAFPLLASFPLPLHVTLKTAVFFTWGVTGAKHCLLKDNN